MAHNKFIKKDGEVLLDLTSDTVASDKLMSGVTAHNRSGEAINGTFTIDNELATQDNLIAQIQTALQGKAAGGSTEDLDSVISELETKAATLNTTLANKAAGGGSVETCTVTITNSRTTLHCFAYNNSTGAVYQTDVTDAINKSTTININKNSVLVVLGTVFVPAITCDVNITYLGPGNTNSHVKAFVFSVTGNGSIVIHDND